MHRVLTRRTFMVHTAAVGMAAALGPARGLAVEPGSDDGPFRLGLNTATVRGLKLPLPDIVDLAAKAGYRAIEPWIGELQHVAEGGNNALKDLGKRAHDAGMTIDNAIGFAPWIVDDDARRAKGLEQAKRDMDLVLQTGGTGIAAAPSGAREPIPVPRIAERYRALLDLAQKTGCRAHLEFWGPSKTMGRLETALEVLAAANHPHASVLPDVYHMYKGGSDFATVKKLTPKNLYVFHLNDYPADPPRETINDGQRVYPGDGIAPLKEILRDLRDLGFRGALSLELFNKEYLQAGAETVLRTGLEKMRAAVRKALA